MTEGQIPRHPTGPQNLEVLGRKEKKANWTRKPELTRISLKWLKLQSCHQPISEAS